MFVYVISAGDERHKVGIAASPERRLKELQTGAADQLFLVFSRHVGKYMAGPVERRAHSILASTRLVGEWFSVQADHAVAAIEQAIEDLNGKPSQETKKKSPTCLRVPPYVIEQVTQWAMVRGIARNAAYVQLLEAGLKGDRNAR